MRIAFFTSGGAFGYWPLASIISNHEVVALIRPQASRRPVKSFLKRVAEVAGIRRDPAGELWRRARLPILAARSGRDERIAETLRQIKPDLICISAFPWVLSGDILDTARSGALNVHGSLLPRHRGPAPHFWTYYHNDASTGVTVHVATAKADHGPIVSQEAHALPRGYSVSELHGDHARLGARLLAEAVASLAEGSADPLPQSEELATDAPRVKTGVPMVDFDHWDVERVWHFLAGLFPHHREPLSLGNRGVAYEGVLGHVRSDDQRRAGSLQRAPHGWNLWCQGGYVQLQARGRRTGR